MNIKKITLIKIYTKSILHIKDILTKIAAVKLLQ